MTLCYITIREWYLAIEKSFFLNKTIYIGKTNLSKTSKKRPDSAPTKEEIIDALIEVCIKYDVEYDSFHNHIPSFNRLDSKEIEDRVAEEVELRKRLLKSKL